MTPIPQGQFKTRIPATGRRHGRIRLTRTFSAQAHSLSHQGLRKRGKGR